MRLISCTLAAFALVTTHVTAAPVSSEAAFATATANGALVQEGLNRSNRYLHAWLATAEPTTGLIPRNLTDSPYWNGKDSAADNYPFMVLSADFTERPLLAAKLRPMLEAERKLTARPDWLRLTDDYNLQGTPGLRQPKPNAERIFFNSAEYVKDGLLALTEWLGPSPWSERMFELVDDSFALATVDSPFGKIPLAGTDKTVGVEVSGDYLQALARIYWMSGRDEKYLRWGIRLADNFLLPAGKNHPTRDFATLRLRDHGCEIVSGLCEFYATLHYAGRLPGGREWADKKAAYQPHLHEMLDRILAIARNPDGLLYNDVNPRTGAVVDAKLSDSWGYVFDAYYTVFLVDGTAAYRDALIAPLAALDKNYRGYNWEPRPDRLKFPYGSHDGYADSIESALNLYNRFTTEPRVASVTAWMDSEIKQLWSAQRPDGIIEGWHGDGNFARTTIMYCLWKTQGVTAQPWRADLRLGAARDAAGTLHVVLSSEKPWTGKLIFDRPRHAENLRLPVDWPRINQFPEWFTVQSAKTYTVELASTPPARHLGAQLAAGLDVSVTPAAPALLRVAAAPATTTPKLAGLFADHMVLQRETAVPIWGTAAAGETVTVAFAGQTKTAAADATGRWRVQLDPLPASGESRELRVSGSDSSVKISDVLVGEVWLAGGQSNMRFPLSAAHEAAATLPTAGDDQLRLWNVDFKTAAEPQTAINAKWKVSNPATAKDFSAVGYFFARELRQTLGCPVGVICAAWGGTPIETWISVAGLRQAPALARPLARWDDAVRQYRQLQTDPKPAAAYADELRRWRKEVEPAFNAANKAYNALPAAEKARTPKPQPAWPEPQNPDPMGLPSPSRRPQTPSVSFNAMIAPLAPFALRGVIWYQGEANGSAGLDYRELFPRLIQDWRAQWGGEFPFLFVQLPSFGADPVPVAESGWPWTREAQLLTLREPRTAMAVTIDLGDPQDVHPTGKRDVGHRLALLARRDVYGEKLVASGPLLRDFAVEGEKIRLRFRETGGGLTLGQSPWRAKGVEPFSTEKLTGFYVAGDDRRWVEAEATIAGDSVIVSAPSVPRPVAARYAWANSPRANLYNTAGLPASPFRTDTWPLGTAGK